MKVTKRFPGFTSSMCLRCLFIGVLTLPLVGGCDNSKPGDSQTNKTETPQLPKLDFHKPKNLNEAVSRLREIHTAVVADQPIPEPRKFDVVEVIHGKGAGAHSHFYLAEWDYKKLSDHGHEDMHSDEKRHQIEVDVFTEFQDIANWLPRIAAATDGMQAETWNSVSNIASEIVKVTEDLMKDRQNTELLRKSFRDGNQLEGLIKQLESTMGVGNKTEVRESS